MDELEEKRLAARARRAAYDSTEAGRAARQRDRERMQRGYALLRAQGVPREEAKRRARAAAREWLAGQASAAGLDSA
jgi:hypothetical protein